MLIEIWELLLCINSVQQQWSTSTCFLPFDQHSVQKFMFSPIWSKFILIVPLKLFWKSSYAAFVGIPSFPCCSPHIALQCYSSFIRDCVYSNSQRQHYFIFHLSTGLGNKTQSVVPHRVPFVRKKQEGIRPATHQSSNTSYLQRSGRNPGQSFSNFIFEFLLGECHLIWGLTDIQYMFGLTFPVYLPTLSYFIWPLPYLLKRMAQL